VGKQIKVKREKPESTYFMFVDKMDGDAYRGSQAVGEAVRHALDNGAKEIDIRRWKK